MEDPTKTETKMTNPPKQQKMVNIKANHPIRIDDFDDPRKTRHIKEGETALVTEEQAAEFCDRFFERPYPFFGERYQDQSTVREKFYRAVRLK
jgi:hypothetical protein